MNTTEQNLTDTMAESISARVLAALRIEVAKDNQERDRQYQAAFDAIDENWTLRFQTFKAETKKDQTEFEKLVNERLGVSEAEMRKLVDERFSVLRDEAKTKVDEISGHLDEAKKAMKPLADMVERSNGESLRVSKTMATVSMLGAFAAGVGGAVGGMRALENRKLKKAGHTREELNSWLKAMPSDTKKRTHHDIPAAPIEEPVARKL
jgi:hypothetical protein